MENSKEQCPKFESCGASLCPLNIEHLKIGIWHPDEEICKRIPVPGWVRMQRKIAKAARDKDRYFTYKMLKRNCKIAQGILGLNPDKDEIPQLEKWLEIHPAKKELSVLEKKIIAERFKKYREKVKDKT